MGVCRNLRTSLNLNGQVNNNNMTITVVRQWTEGLAAGLGFGCQKGAARASIHPRLLTTPPPAELVLCSNQVGKEERQRQRKAPSKDTCNQSSSSLFLLSLCLLGICHRLVSLVCLVRLEILSTTDSALSWRIANAGAIKEAVVRPIVDRAARRPERARWCW